MTWRGFGPEWHPVLFVLAVVAALVVMASLRWWLGVIGLGAALAALGAVAWK